MSSALLIVGVVVFFISVYGVVMVGGHLLEQLDADDPQQNQPDDDRFELTSPSSTASA